MTYTNGYNLAVKDKTRFGILFAMDKLHLFEEEFAEGYAAGIENSDKE